MDSEVKCRICGESSFLVYKLERNQIINRLSNLLHTDFSTETIPSSYSVYRCKECTLEFADPPIAGNNAFYTLLASLPQYYTTDRPEYKIVMDILLKGKMPLRFLDVGCGDGSFIEKFKGLKNIEGCGIDTTEKSIAACNMKGVKAFCVPVEEFNDKNFDAVVSFHCLEHIPDPVPFMKAMAEKVKAGGSLIIATPYSPFSYEVCWYHPLNNPPHHMLRLNKRSYEKLAELLALNLTFINFGSTSFKSRVRSAMTYALYNDNLNLSPFSFLKLIFAHPFMFFKIAVKQLTRDRINGEIAGDDILVIFQKP